MFTRTYIRMPVAVIRYCTRRARRTAEPTCADSTTTPAVAAEETTRIVRIPRLFSGTNKLQSNSSVPRNNVSTFHTRSGANHRLFSRSFHILSVEPINVAKFIIVSATFSARRHPPVKNNTVSGLTAPTYVVTTVVTTSVKRTETFACVHTATAV